MIYKYLPAVEGELKILARIDDDNVCRLTCTEHEPEYLKWIEEGNVPTSAEEQ